MKRTILILALLLVLSLGGWWSIQRGWARADLATGWALLAVVLLMPLYEARKKLEATTLGRRLGALHHWLAAHASLGAAGVILFFLHACGPHPGGQGDLLWQAGPGSHGWLESVLAVLFIGSAVSGLAGYGLKRTLPKRLTALGGGVSMPWLDGELERLTRQLEDAVERGEDRLPGLRELHGSELAAFVAHPANFWHHLAGLDRSCGRLVDQVLALRSDPSVESAQALAELVHLLRRKDRLDRRRAQTVLLRGWVLVHQPLTRAMIALALVHAGLAHLALSETLP